MATESELLKAYNDSTQAGAPAPAAGAGAGAAAPAGSSQTPQETAPAAPAAGGAQTPAAGNNVANGAYSTARADAINQMYDAQRAAREAELKNAYEQSMSGYRQAQEKLAPEYQQKANDLAVQYERQRQNFWNQAAASGINTGVSAQESLARGGEYQRDFGSLRTSEAEQQAAIERQMADREAQYQNDIAAALAENDYQRAQALYNEYNTGYDRDLENAKIMASYGDFSFFENLYGKDQANNMFLLWAAQNPELAHNTGRITDDQYNNLINGKNMNDGLDENGKRIISTPAGGGAYNYWDAVYGSGGGSSGSGTGSAGADAGSSQPVLTPTTINKMENASYGKKPRSGSARSF